MTKTPITVELNIFDLDAIVRQHLAARYPQFEIKGWSVRSWNTPVVVVSDGTMETPVGHHLRADHAMLPWPMPLGAIEDPDA